MSAKSMNIFFIILILKQKKKNKIKYCKSQFLIIITCGGINDVHSNILEQ